MKTIAAQLLASLGHALLRVAARLGMPPATPSEGGPNPKPPQ